jgi:hypothetical protein
MDSGRHARVLVDKFRQYVYHFGLNFWQKSKITVEFQHRTAVAVPDDISEAYLVLPIQNLSI